MTEEILDHPLNSLVEGILDSYDKYPLIRNIDSSNRINRAIVLDILENLRKIVFPGYFETRNLKQDSLSYHVGEILEDIHYNLIKQTIAAPGRTCTGKQGSSSFRGNGHRGTLSCKDPGSTRGSDDGCAGGL